MTQMEFQWGEPISGLTHDDIAKLRLVEKLEEIKFHPVWPLVFSLRANHPYYVATSKGFTYWPGGESAPDDWDGGDVLRRGGEIHRPAPWVAPYEHNQRWTRADFYVWADIIGYRRKTIAGPLPARWAEKRMLEECGGCIEGPNPVATAFARYIEQHEKPPVDPDVLAVREILAAYTLHFDESYVTEGIYKAGEGDGQTWFQAALAAYRTAIGK